MKEGSVSVSSLNGGLEYRCSVCGHKSPRALIIDPGINWWLDSKNEYWHEVAGVFAANEQGEYLFFERTRHPSGLTVPAGHVDRGEKPTRTAVREFEEEAGAKLQAAKLTLIATDNVVGDECRRGADAHRWHSFATRVTTSSISVDKREGVNPVWLSLEAALQRDLTFVMRYVISRHARAIGQAVR